MYNYKLTCSCMLIKLMLCIVFMEVSGGQLTKYISGGKKQNKTKNKKKNLFNRLPDGQPHLFS